MAIYKIYIFYSLCSSITIEIMLQISIIYNSASSSSSIGAEAWNSRQLTLATGKLCGFHPSGDSITGIYKKALSGEISTSASKFLIGLTQHPAITCFTTSKYLHTIRLVAMLLHGVWVLSLGRNFNVPLNGAL